MASICVRECLDQSPIVSDGRPIGVRQQNHPSVPEQKVVTVVQVYPVRTIDFLAPEKNWYMVHHQAVPPSILVQPQKHSLWPEKGSGYLRDRTRETVDCCQRFESQVCHLEHP